MKIILDTFKLREALFYKQMSQQQLRDKIEQEYGVSYTTGNINQVILGNNHSYKCCALICNILGLQISDIYTMDYTREGK